MPPIIGTWSTDGYIVTTLFNSVIPRYKAYFSVPSETVDGTRMLAKFKFYGDSNNNGIYDSDDLFIAPVTVKSYGNLGGSNGTVESPEGSNIAYSYIDGIAVGEAYFEISSPWESVGGLPSGNNGSPTPQTTATSPSVDSLTGIKNSKDVFRFDATPDGQVERVIGFSLKDKDTLSISRIAFGIEGDTFAVAKNAKALAKQQRSNTDIVYYRKTGELMLNANGAEPGFGDDGGAFAVLTGKPLLNIGSVVFF
jgi:hypothetical protein